MEKQKPNTTQDVLWTQQYHQADRAGPHFDYRMVIGSAAHSWASKKDIPEVGKSIILHQTSIHSREYALTKRVVIPKGNYGSGTTTLQFVRKAKLERGEDHFIVHTSQNERYLLKPIPSYGKKQWLFKNLGPESKSMEKVALHLELYQHDETGRTCWKEPGWKQEGWSAAGKTFYRRKGQGMNKKAEVEGNRYLIKVAELIEKQALNALMARTMAKKVGIIPVTGSQWKWGLRNLRNGRGDPLEGRALDEARKRMGSLDNHSMDAIEKANRQFGHAKEFDPQASKLVSGMGIRPKDLTDDTRKMFSDKKITSVGSETAFAKPNNSSISRESLIKGTPGQFIGNPIAGDKNKYLAKVKTALRNKDPGLIPTPGIVHTHPANPDSKNYSRTLALKKNYSERTPSSTSMTSPSGHLNMYDPKKLSLTEGEAELTGEHLSYLHLMGKSQGSGLSNTKLFKRRMSTPPSSGGINTEALDDKTIAAIKGPKGWNSSDMQMFHNPTQQQQATHNIVNPFNREESVHKVTTHGLGENGSGVNLPTGMRSVYFDRSRK